MQISLEELERLIERVDLVQRATIEEYANATRVMEEMSKLAVKLMETGETEFEPNGHADLDKTAKETRIQLLNMERFKKSNAARIKNIRDELK